MSKRTTSLPATAGSADSDNPSELRFLLPESKTNMRALFGGAGVSWAMIAIAVAFMVWLRPDQALMAVVDLPDFPLQDIVFIEQEGPGGGGGGGGNKSPDPPKTNPIPKVKPPEPDPEPIPIATPEPPPPVPEPEPEVAAEIPAITPTTQIAQLGPSINTAPASLGSGTGRGAGTGRGDGIGSGSGDGVGPGKGGGTGGGIYQPGSGITNPTLIRSAKPNYTSEAMLRRIQGVVLLDCVVGKSGSVDNCDIFKSLDSNQFGLDNEAMKAAKNFLFRPGLRQGEPVNVLVRIEIAFNMR